MNFLKRIARSILFPFTVGVHLEKFISSFSGNKYLVLMYHGVVKKQNNTVSVNHLSLVDFERHIEYLRRNFEIVSLKELFDRKRKGIKPKRRTIAITFDDGYENNYTNAFPVLMKYNIPATIFTVAECIRNPDNILWYDFVDIVKESINYKDLQELQIPLPEEKAKQLRTITDLSGLRTFLKTLTTAEKKLVLDNILSKENAAEIISLADPEYRRMLNAGQMREMTNSNLVEIGSHTLSHPNLDTLNESELTLELQQSKKILSEALSSEVISIAFPDGAYNEKVKEFAKNTGYQNLLAVPFKLTSDRNDNSILQRFCISNTTTPESNFIQIHLAFYTLGF